MGKIKFSQKKSTDTFISDEKWKVLICDDEKEVHSITKTVLRDFIFKHKKLEFIFKKVLKIRYDEKNS